VTAARVSRMKRRLLAARYEICLARARHFTDVYRETEGLDPALRNAQALRRTLERQRISIEPDEWLAGSKTERFLAGPLSVERGDFLRTLQLELPVLHRKQRPFFMSSEDRDLFRQEILPYWDGRTVRDRKAAAWEEEGLVTTRSGLPGRARTPVQAARFLSHVGLSGVRRLLGVSLRAPITIGRAKDLYRLRHELAWNNPTPATYCFDVQGHLCLGIDRVVREGMDAIAQRARARMSEDTGADPHARAFLQAAAESLEAAIAYAERFAALAERRGGGARSAEERGRLSAIAAHCRHVPRHPARTFHEALQAAWMAHVVGEIQYGTHDVFAVGRADQFLEPLYARDLCEGRIDREEAVALVQEYLLKLSANVEPIPELGTETNSVLGNSQHCVTIGGLRPDGEDGTNDLSFLFLEAYERMGGSVNQLCVRLHRRTPAAFLERAAAVFRRCNGLAFYNDDAIVPGLLADGYTAGHARDYCIVGCVETSGQSNTHGCPGGHELVLPAVLVMALTGGREPCPAPGQRGGRFCGDPASFRTFEQLFEAFSAQLAEQVETLVRAVAAKDRAHRDLLPAPYVSALMHGCLERAMDMTAGGATYDFTSIDLRGLATLVDSLLAVRTFVYERHELSLVELVRAVRADFRGREALRQRLLREAPKYGTGAPEADALALRVLDFVAGELRRYRNVRGGRFRACYYSYGNHVIDGILLGATPDGRRRGEPISNGVSMSNLVLPTAGPTGPMRTVARFPPPQVSGGVSLNLRFHPRFVATDNGLRAFAGLLRTYFAQGGMHVQPNVVSTETLRDAQRHPERHRDLIVKVAGYSAYFTDLGRSIQEDIVARCEFGG